MSTPIPTPAAHPPSPSALLPPDVARLLAVFARIERRRRLQAASGGQGQ